MHNIGQRPRVSEMMTRIQTLLVAINNDDVIKWKHFPRFVREIHRWPLTKVSAFFDLRLNKRLSKLSRRRWFETPSRSFWHPCNDIRQQSRQQIVTLRASSSLSFYWLLGRLLHRFKILIIHEYGNVMSMFHAEYAKRILAHGAYKIEPGQPEYCIQAGMHILNSVRPGGK